MGSKPKESEEQSRQAMPIEGKMKGEERDAQRKAEKTRKVTNSRSEDSTSSHGMIKGVATTSEAIRKAASRDERAMLKTSTQYAEVLARLINKSTPKKKKILDEKGISSTSKFTEESSASVKRLFDTLSKQRNKKALTRKRILAVAVSVKNRYRPGYRNHQTVLGIGRKLTKLATAAKDADELEVQKRRKDAMPVEDLAIVKEFFHRGDNSRDLPDARSAKKVGDQVKSRNVMDLILRSAFEKFCNEYPSVSISFSKFKQLRPPNILIMSNNKRAQCLCEYCTNIEFKLNSISHFMAQHQLGRFSLKDKHDISRMTLCSKENGEYRKVCLDRQCNMCGIHLLEFDKLVQHNTDEMKWFRWESKEFDFNGGTIRRMTKVNKNGTVHHLISELKTEMAPLSKHLFNASWQWRQYDNVSKNVPPNWVIFCLDYAENYACQSQDEAQGAHWSNVQATIHPVVASYRCEEAGCDKIVRDSIFFISDDIKHCYHGVQHFSKGAVAQLEEKGIQIAKVIHFTDGSPTQYKSKVNFADVSMSQEDFGFSSEKHFFGSRHGKGPCDREIGVLQKKAKLAVNARQVEISNAYDHCFGMANLTRPYVQNEHCHEKRRFIFVKNGEIDRDRPERTDVKPLKGTRQLHCVRGSGEPYKVLSRECSCFCISCTTRVGECQYIDLVGKWKVSELKKKKPTHTVDIADHEGEHNRGNTDGSSRDISIGEYVAVKIQVSQPKNSSNNSTVYMALVMDKADDEFIVKFMRNLSFMRNLGLYSFPEQERPFTHPHSDILCKVNPPSLRTKRSGDQYIFAEEDLKKVYNSVSGSVTLK